MGAGRRGGRRGVSGRVAALGDDGVFEPEVEGEEGADEGTPRWAQLIEALLDHGIDGAGVTSSAKELADKYEANPKYSTVEERVEALLRFEAAKSFAAGFLTGVGGVWTIPVAVPAAVYANWVLQARIAGAIAHMYGHDLRSTQVRTLCLMCLLGDNAISVLKTMGVRVAEKAASKAINSIPTAVLVRLNKAVGSTLVVKCGKGGMIKLHRAVPLVGGVVAGSFDAGACMMVGRVAVRLFRPPPLSETDEDTLALDWAGTVDVEDYTVL